MVTVSAPEAKCNPRYGPNAQVPGVMAVKAEPYGVDWCDDTGTNNRANQGEAELERASCAEPMKPLTITR